MSVPAVALGALVVFCLGYVLAYFFTVFVLNRISRQIAAGKGMRAGPGSPLDRRTPDVDQISIAGGVLAVALLLILLSTAPAEPGLMIWYGLIGTVAILGILALFLFGSSFGSTRSTSSMSVSAVDLKTQSPGTSTASLYQRLLLKAGGDRDLTERLIEYERKRKPGASRAELIGTAIERWERDNNR